MKQLCNSYIRHAGLIGAVYCAVPALGWFIVTTASVPFREVYLLRLGLCLSLGSAIAAYLNRYGHRRRVRFAADALGPDQDKSP